MIQHILGGQKSSRTLGSFFEVPFYLGASIPGYLDGTEFQFLSSQPSEAGNKGQCCSPLALCPVLVTGRHCEGKVRFFSVGSLGLSVPSNSWVVVVFFPFLVCFVFYLTFIVISMGIRSDIAIPS